MPYVKCKWVKQFCHGNSAIEGSHLGHMLDMLYIRVQQWVHQSKHRSSIG